MLRRLHIENLAIAENAEVELAEGLVAVTGETGAGKSIVVGALELALGARASSDAVRKGERVATIEAVFDPPHPRRVAPLIASAFELEWDSREPLTIRREVSARGRSRCFIADQQVNVADLKRLGELLVDLHGQHEHQSLFHRSAQRSALDAFGRYDALIEKYQASYREYVELKRRRDDLERESRDFEKRLDFLDFQIRELEESDPRDGELGELAAEEAKLGHAESLAHAANSGYALLYDGEGDNRPSVLARLGEAARSLAEIAEIDPEMADLPPKCAEIEALVEDLGLTLRDYAAGCEADPKRLESVIQRTEEIRRLLRKHDAENEKTLVETRDRMIAERDKMNLDESERAEIEAKVGAAETAALALAGELHEARAVAARRLGSTVAKTLGQVGMEKAKFEISVRDTGTMTSDGADEVEFLLAANPGEGSHPLREVASGGELSRTMLALKTALAKRDAIPILVFDEIDAGISGETAARVGKLMEKLAESHQVVCITHHASIAARAGHHLSIRKTTSGRRTRMSAVALNKNERLEELARMMGGDGSSAAGKRLAKQLLGSAS